MIVDRQTHTRRHTQRQTDTLITILCSPIGIMISFHKKCMCGVVAGLPSMIQYDAVFLMCTGKLADSQLNLPHGNDY